MSYNTRLNILLTMVFLVYGLLFALLLLGYFFPGDPAPNKMPWFVWAAIGEMIIMVIATFTIGFIVHKKDKQKKAGNDNK